MPTFEEICEKLTSDEHFFLRLFLWGLITSVPILNILALGYLYRYAQVVRRSGNCVLPTANFRDWKDLFLDGLRFLLILCLFLVFPVLVVGTLAYSVLGGVLVMAGHPAMTIFGSLFVLLSVIACLPLALVVFFGPVVTVAALFNFQRDPRFEELARLDRIVARVRAAGRRIFVPSFSFCGLLVVGLPLLGFALFLGFVVVIAYFTVTFAVLEKRSNMV